MNLFNTFKSLILEIASVDSIVDAIKKRRRVVIYYDGDEPGGRGLRTIEPVCFGYSKADNPVVRAWDLDGASHRGYLGTRPMPGWRLFRVDKILSFKPTSEIFNTPRPEYNPNGDDLMAKIILNAKFDVTPTLVDNIEEIVINVVSNILRGLTTARGIDYIIDIDLSKAAETYRQIYSLVQKQIGRNLTDEEKRGLRGEVLKIIQDNQEDLKKQLQ
jgi:hypothetical protein